jgi:pimeloyl-ACP methyl ester carboxylesterase
VTSCEFDPEYEIIEECKDTSEGCKNDVILLHGICSDSHNYDALTDELKKQNRVILFNMRGHRRVDRETNEFIPTNVPDPKFCPYSMDSFSNDILKVMDETDVKDAVLVGHSFGAIVSRKIVSEHPERVKRTVLINGLDEAPNRLAGQVMSSVIRTFANLKSNKPAYLPYYFGDRLNRKWVSNAASEEVTKNIIQNIRFKFPNEHNIPTLAINSVFDIFDPIVENNENFLDYRSFISGHLIAANRFNIDEVVNFVTTGNINKEKFITINGSLFDRII